MTESTDDKFVIQSSEARRARQLKSGVMDLLEEVILIMEDARRDGFEVQFSIQRNQEGANFINNDLVKVIKTW